MIWLYTGTPGSGKSVHVVKDMVTALSQGRPVIANFPINTAKIRGYKDNFYYLRNDQITVRALRNFARRALKRGKENQCLVVIDEAAAPGLFNCRDFAAEGRGEWCAFFAQHRHMGYNFILIAQFDRMLDRQIRGLAEYEVKHRKINNYGGVGVFLRILHLDLFYCLEYWYSARVCTNRSFFVGGRRLYRRYDSFADIGAGHGAPAPVAAG